MEDLRQDLRAVTKKCRPDWDITTPEPNSKRSGSKDARSSSIHTARRTPKLSVSRIRIRDFRFPILECGADSNRRSIETEAGHRPDRTIKEARMNLKLEAIFVPVSDVDRAKKFYQEALGFRVDVDHRAATYEEALGFRHRGEASYRIV
jgi:hypothetical protein